MAKFSMPESSIKDLPYDRSYSKFEARGKIEFDLSNGNKFSLRDYAKEFGWSVWKVKEFLNQTPKPTGYKGKEPKTKQKKEERQKDFGNSLVQYVAEYGKEMIRDFYTYWGEPNGTKIRFELEKTWDTKMRLVRWKSNNFNKVSGGDTEKAENYVVWLRKQEFIRSSPHKQEALRKAIRSSQHVEEVKKQALELI